MKPWHTLRFGGPARLFKRSLYSMNPLVYGDVPGQTSEIQRWQQSAIALARAARHSVFIAWWNGIEKPVSAFGVKLAKVALSRAADEQLENLAKRWVPLLMELAKIISNAGGLPHCHRRQLFFR